MIFIINGLKWDTDKMKLISTKCMYKYLSIFGVYNYAKASLYQTKNDRWMITYETDRKSAKALSIEEVKALLLTYDLDKYEELFGELEEEA